MSWKPWKPSKSEPWNLLRVWTLHRRAGFAATWSQLQRDLADGPEESIQRLLRGDPNQPGTPDNFAEMTDVLGDAAIGSTRPERLTAWWIYHLYFSPHPLRERMTLVWHNHFATSNAKVKNLVLMRQQNNVFRTDGLGSFQTLLTKVLKQGAMLRWLDGDSNRSGMPNENLGRELLELFTLGAGNYTEGDVKDASRALTGWSVYQDQFRIREDWHDSASKTILGNTGNLNGDDLVDITCRHPATALRVSERISHTFLADSVVTPESLEGLADVLTKNEFNIHKTIEVILRSQYFHCSANLKQRIAGPESFVIGTLRALEFFQPPASTLVLSDWIEQLGRKLFYPPNVGGWPGGRAWLNSRTSIARANFGAALVEGRLNRTGQTVDLLGLAEANIGNRKWDDIAPFYCQLLTGRSDREFVQPLLEKAKTELPDSSEPEQTAKRLVTLILASPQAQLN